MPPRKSNRITYKPEYLKDYIYNNVVLTDLTSACFIHLTYPTTCSFASLSLHNQHVFASIFVIHEPKSFAQASVHPETCYAGRACSSRF